MRRTRGGQVAALAAGMGRPLHTWQRETVNVACELDRHGRYWYRTVVVLVPRQAGKSLLTGMVMEHRALTIGAARVWYTAQTGDTAGTWLRDEHLPILQAAELFAGRWRSRLTRGSESVRWQHGSNVTVFPPTRESLHSKQSDLVVVDEAWAHDYVRGGELLQAIGPTQATRPGAQVWIVSAAGDASSTFLADMLVSARAAGTDDRVCLVEYGVPDSMDATDPAVAARYHPGVASGLIDADYLRTETQRMDGPGFARAYGNVFSVARAAVIPGPTWSAAGTDPGPMPERPALGFDCEHDGTGAAVAAAWRDGTRWRVELVDDRPGTSWVPERVTELTRHYREPAAYGAGGPALAVAAAAERSHARLAPITGHDWYAACETFRAAVADGQLAHSAQPTLDAAVAAADARRVGDVWTWDRRAPGARLAPLTAATAALWAAVHQRPRPRPVILGTV